MLLALLTSVVAHADDRRPVYVIAHCANNQRRVEEAIAAGANGVELDLMLRRGKLMARHGGLEPLECGARTSAAALPALLQSISDAMVQGQLAVLIVDTKQTAGQGEEVGATLGAALAAAGIPEERVIASIPMAEGATVRAGLAGARYDPRIDLYLSDYGTTDPDLWMQNLNAAAADVAGVGMDPIAFWRPMPWWKRWLQTAVARRDDGSGPSFTYYWTLNEPSSAALVFAHGVDGLITNYPERVVAVLDPTLRLAAASEALP